MTDRMGPVAAMDVFTRSPNGTAPETSTDKVMVLPYNRVKRASEPVGTGRLLPDDEPQPRIGFGNT